jgi:hypothetical protein
MATMIKLTTEEAIARFSKAGVMFSSYYKYAFSFVGKHDGCTIYCDLGGNSDGVYRLRVTVSDLEMFERPEKWACVTILDAEGNEIFSYSDL